MGTLFLGPRWTTPVSLLSQSDDRGRAHAPVIAAERFRVFLISAPGEMRECDFDFSGKFLGSDAISLTAVARFPYPINSWWQLVALAILLIVLVIAFRGRGKSPEKK
jgi:hypothetical protein